MVHHLVMVHQEPVMDIEAGTPGAAVPLTAIAMEQEIVAHQERLEQMELVGLERPLLEVSSMECG